MSVMELGHLLTRSGLTLEYSWKYKIEKVVSFMVENHLVPLQVLVKLYFLHINAMEYLKAD